MKKNLLYLFMLVCSVGLFTSCGDDDDDNNDKPDVAGTYAGNLGVTIDDSDPITSSQTIELTSPAETKINFTLKNFILQAGAGGEAGQTLPVGNIKITDIDLVGSNGNYTFTKTSNIKIEAGDQAGISEEQWLGPTVLYPFLLFSVARFSVLLLISFLFLISEYGTLLFLKYFR